MFQKLPWLLSLALHGVIGLTLLLTASEAREPAERPMTVLASIEVPPTPLERQIASPEEETAPDPAVLFDFQLPPASLPPPVEPEPAPEEQLPDDTRATWPEPAPEPAPRWDVVHLPRSALRRLRREVVVARTPPMAPPLPSPTTPPATRVRSTPVPRAAPALRPPPPRIAAPGPPLRVLFAPDAGRYYPAEARRRGLMGSALVSLTIDGGGRVVRAEILRSTGNRALDDAALRLARAYRFSRAPGLRRTRLPVVFRIA